LEKIPSIQRFKSIEGVEEEDKNRMGFFEMQKVLSDPDEVSYE
jgi:hypothetical protein